VRNGSENVRRTLRILLNAATVLSLVLCVAACGFWAYQALPPHLVGYSRGCVFATFCEDAEFVGGCRQLRPDGGAAALCYTNLVRATPAPHRFSFQSGRVRGGTNRWWAIAIPMWAIVVATVILPAARAARRLRSHRRRRVGGCPSCGYDLRATPERCPECGHVPMPSTGRSKK
jgi:hypothetical protein